MAFGGFICSKNALTALNSLYIVVAVILIGVGAYAHGSSIVTALPVVAGIIATGVFLLLVAILGLYGAAKHHQVILFFYMVILFLIFLIQFFVAIGCLAIRQAQLETLIKTAWEATDNSTSTKVAAAKHFHCCERDLGNCSEWCPESSKNECFGSCVKEIPKYAFQALRVAGAVGLFFSFTEILGIWLAMRYRNQKNPKANPDLFL